MDELRGFVLSGNGFNTNVMREVADGFREILEEKGASTDVAQHLKKLWSNKLEKTKKNDMASTSRAMGGPKTSSFFRLKSNKFSSSESSSEDDSADIKMGETLLNSVPTVVCQYDSVTHSGNVWNLLLRDGIVHVDGKDVVFQRATGDAKW